MKCHYSLLGVAGIVVFSFASHAQTTTIRSGKWSSPSTWSNGIVPDASSGQIVIAHDVTISEDTTLAVDEVILNARLTIARHAQLILENARGVPDLSLLTGSLYVNGRLTCRDSATVTGTTSLNTFFLDSSVYEHQYFSITGEPPTATWSDHSTLELTGFTTGKSLSSLKWNQVYGNVTYNCQAQRNGTFVEFLGNIQTIKNNLLIKSTGSGVLRITLDKTALTTISIGGDFVIEGNAMVWMSRNGNTRVDVNGNFEYRSSATASSYLTTQGNGELNVAGNFLMNSVGILRFASSGGGSGTINVRRDFNLNAGTMTFVAPGQGRISMAGDTPQSVNIQGTIATGVNLEIVNASGVNITSGSKMQGNILIKFSGTLKLPATSFSLQGNLTAELGGDIVSNHGTLEINGPMHQNIDLPGDTLHHITISKPSGTNVSLASSLHLKGALTISSPGVSLISNGNLMLLSTRDDGMEESSIAALPVGSSIVGDVTVQRFMSGEGRIYRYLSSPVINATVADWKDDFPITGTFDDPSTGPGLNSAGLSLFAYDETLSNGGWINYPADGLASENILTTGKGYSAFIRSATAPTVWDVTGALNQHTVNLPVTYTATVDSLMDGWNLVGNPYASTIDWDRDEGWTRENIASKIAIRDNSTGTFKYWDGAVGNLANGRVAIGQAFWVQSTASNPVLTINEEAKATITGIFFREKKQDVDVLQLTLSGEKVSDESFLKLDAEANHHFDAHDLIKWPNDFLNFSFRADSIPLAIDVREAMACGTEVPLVMNFIRRADVSLAPAYFGSYTLSFDARGLFKYTTIALRDNYLDSVIMNGDGAYHFYIDDSPGSYDRSRFSLSVASRGEGNSPVIVYDSVVCEASHDPVIRILNPSKGIRYDCKLNHQLISSVLAHNDSAISISFAKNLLLAGKNVLELVSRNACTTIGNVNFSIHKLDALSPPVLVESEGAIVSSGKGDWFFKGEVIAEEVMLIRPIQSGWYEQRVARNGCTSIAGTHFIHQESNWQWSPVPTDQWATITAPKGATISNIEIVSSAGIRCQQLTYHQEKEVVLNLSLLSAGIYLARVTGTGAPVIIRLYKR